MLLLFNVLLLMGCETDVTHIYTMWLAVFGFLQYARNALLFNVGFVFDESMDTEPYHNSLRKVSCSTDSSMRI
jgi:EamA domain-containing membrane protein RarD